MVSSLMHKPLSLQENLRLPTLNSSNERTTKRKQGDSCGSPLTLRDCHCLDVDRDTRQLLPILAQVYLVCARLAGCDPDRFVELPGGYALAVAKPGQLGLAGNIDEHGEVVRW